MKLSKIKTTVDRALESLRECEDLVLDHEPNFVEEEKILQAAQRVVSKLLTINLDCENIEDCRFCENCIDCDRCENCIDCDNCYRCENCADCYECERCADCQVCGHCYASEGCMSCEGLVCCFGLVDEKDQFFKASPEFSLTDKQKALLQIAAQYEAAKGAKIADALEARRVLKRARSLME